MIDDRIAAVAQLREAHLGAAFPRRLLCDDAAGVDMVMLDADVSGCVSTWLKNGGGVDEQRWNILTTRERDLDRVMSELSGDEAAFYKRLLDMTTLILGSSDDRPLPDGVY